MREIIFDTETTGLEPAEGHKLIEIGCVEMIDGVVTGNHYHVYLNPERDVAAEAVAVHGLTRQFLSNKPIFAQEVGNFLDFIGENDVLVAHNAKFDMNFVNYELKTHGFDEISYKRVVDTLQIAREKFPGSPASLDALCRRFEIDNSNRELHGALLDAELLAEVYIELSGGKQRALDLAAELASDKDAQSKDDKAVRVTRTARPIIVSDAAKTAHASFVGNMDDPIWSQYKN